MLFRSPCDSLKLRHPTAPEVILKEAHAGYGAQVDSWSIGVVLYSCMTNSTPFDESESTPLPQRMAERRVDFDGLEEYGISDTGACDHLFTKALRLAWRS